MFFYTFKDRLQKFQINLEQSFLLIISSDRGTFSYSTRWLG